MEILTEESSSTLFKNTNDFSIHYRRIIIPCYGVWIIPHLRSGKNDLRDPIDEHAKMHELGIAHGHGGGTKHMQCLVNLNINMKTNELQRKTKKPSEI